MHNYSGIYVLRLIEVGQSEYTLYIASMHYITVNGQVYCVTTLCNPSNYFNREL